MPTFWPSPFMPAISAAANFTPNRFSMAMIRLMCIIESQPSMSSAVVESFEDDLVVTENLPKHVL